ncbi:beta-ribofuranosylaminobenzene 5'-phosphate synthase family protein [Rhizobium leguminosarum]|uniref:beta-ribofuranosylaminobenzene 5'-phosphate synthase family protein n=1 Tax=Rhizobium leguminosarum TaxID=384 RepID=UPI003F99C453
MSLTIEVFPRIHVGLISMHEGGPRRNGGLGFSIAAPSAILRFERSGSFSLADKRKTPVSEAERQAILSRLDALADKFSLKSGVAITLEGKMLTHHGMGSGSAIRLACIEGALLSEDLTYGMADIVAASGRGGTSGVGISTYFSGGFVFDLGISSEKGAGFLPSSKVNAASVPLVLTQTDFPQWPLGVCIPHGCKPKTQDEEVEFFEREAPINRDGSYEAAYTSVFGVLSSVLEMDYRAFSIAINMMQATTWKRLEAEQYGHDLQRARSALTELGADCVGMSSLGPMLYFFGPGDRLREIYDRQAELNVEVILTVPNNVGRKIAKT